MKFLILGATGNMGQRLLAQGLARGHHVTAFVRNRSKLEQQLATTVPPGLSVFEGDVNDAAALRPAMTGHDVVINCAGYVADGAAFIELVDHVVTQAETALGPGGRLWLFGGAAALDVPGTDVMGVDLPGVPAIYQAHQTNYRRVAASTLDWSLMCPGPMVPSANGQARPDLRISKDIWPFPRPGYTRWLPRIATSLAFKSHAPELIVSYDDVAAVLLDHLPPGGRFSRARVGVALPEGQRGVKVYAQGGKTVKVG
jgi:putative NADH-flavin reductase